MSSYPKAFSYFLSRLNGFSRQKVSLATMANTTFNANDQIVITLPEGLIDLTTFQLQGRASTSGGLAHGVYLPFVEGLIDSISVEVGGVSVQNGFTNYGDLFNIFRQYQMDDRRNFREVLQLEDRITGGATASNGQNSNLPFACWNWLGFLGSVKVLDTTLLPPVKLYIRLASNYVLTNHSTNAGTKTYTLSSVKASVDLLDISDGVYYNAIASRIAQAPLEIPYDNYQTITGTLGAPSQTTRLTTSTDCLTDIIATFKNVKANDYSYNSNTNLSDFFTRGGKDTTVDITSSQFAVNGVPYPTIPMMNADGEVFAQTAHVLGVAQDTVGCSEPEMNSLARWSSNNWTHAVSFTYPESGEEHRLCGLSGRGNVINATWQTVGTGSSNIQPLVWLKSKSVLRVGANRMVETVL